MFYIWFKICIVYLVHVYRLLYYIVLRGRGREDKERSSVVILVKNNVSLAKIVLLPPVFGNRKLAIL